MDQDSDVVSISSSSNSDGESESLVDTNPSAASTTSTCPSSSASRNPPRAREGEESADDETIYRYGRERRRAYKDVGGRLGSGSEARVKLVVSREDGRQYALKVVPKPSDPAIKKRIERNARRRWDRLASLLTDHPNVGVFQEGFETSSQCES